MDIDVGIGSAAVPAEVGARREPFSDVGAVRAVEVPADVGARREASSEAGATLCLIMLPPSAELCRPLFFMMPPLLLNYAAPSA